MSIGIWNINENESPRGKPTGYHVVIASVFLRSNLILQKRDCGKPTGN